VSGQRGIRAFPEDIRICHTTEKKLGLQDYCDSIVALALFLSGANQSESARAVGDGQR
jgi:hypothetical protein